MRKINFWIFILITLSFLSGCAGYKPIFASMNLEFQISNHLLEGNKPLGNKIYSKIYNISNLSKSDQNQKNLDVYINVKKDKKATSKNTSGKILEYKITLNTNIKIDDHITKTNLLQKKYTFSSTYKVQAQYSDTLQRENRSVENLINNTFQEFLIDLSDKIGTK